MTEHELFAVHFKVPADLYYDEVSGKHFVRHGVHSDTAKYVRLCQVAIELDRQWIAWEARARLATKHPDDRSVDIFADNMKARLTEKRAAGYSGWDDPAQCPVERLATLLVRAVQRGDAINVANYAMMLHTRGAEPEVLAAAFDVGMPSECPACKGTGVYHGPYFSNPCSICAGRGRTPTPPTKR